MGLFRTWVKKDLGFHGRKKETLTGRRETRHDLLECRGTGGFAGANDQNLSKLKQFPKKKSP
jgi:hypothetical protein